MNNNLELFIEGPYKVKFRDRFWFFSWDRTVQGVLDKKFQLPHLSIDLTSWVRTIPVKGPVDLRVYMIDVGDKIMFRIAVVLDGSDLEIWSEEYSLTQEQIVSAGVQLFNIKLDNVRGVTCDITAGIRVV